MDSDKLSENLSKKKNKKHETNKSEEINKTKNENINKNNDNKNNKLVIKNKINCEDDYYLYGMNIENFKNLDYFCDDEELKYKLKKEYENERSIND